MTLILEMVDVSRIHGEGHLAVQALTNASLTVESGQLVAVMGPSGSGKTTLLSIAGGLDRQTTGSVQVEGQELSALSPAKLARLRRRRIGYVFQQLNLIEGLTAAENVSLPLELDGMGLKEARAHAQRALEAVGLQDLDDRFPDDLSGGEQQRVAIARAVANAPRILLADEPTGNLDPRTSEHVFSALTQLVQASGLALVVATHNMDIAARMDRRVTIKDGLVVELD
jgi:putative ABC transport system ATP-binding protein